MKLKKTALAAYYRRYRKAVKVGNAARLAYLKRTAVAALVTILMLAATSTPTQAAPDNNCPRQSTMQCRPS